MVFLAILLLAGGALAYIAPANFLMDKMAERRGKMGMTRLSLTAQCHAGDEKPHEERWFFKLPGMVRREHGPDNVEVCVQGKCWQKTGKEKAARRPFWAYLPYLYFVEGSATGNRYLGLLESLKVDIRHDTLARFHGRLAVVLGAKEWERDRPQFWIDKDTFLPLRLMVLEGKSLVEILWIDWGSRATGDWFPAILEINSDGKELERCEIIRVDASQPVSEELFHLPGM